MIRVEFQCLDKASFQFGEKVQRSAEECDIAVDGASLREVADGLVDDRLEDGECNVRFLRAVIHERLYVSLGEYAAARSDSVDALALLGECVQPDGIGREERRHVIDERSRAARADTVHALLRRVAEIGNLRIFAAELHCGRRLGDKTAHCRGTRDDFLHERQSDTLCDAHARRAGQREREFRRADDLLELREVFL